MTHDDLDIFVPKTGLIEDEPDSRDFQYSEILGASEAPIDWEKGFNVIEALKLHPHFPDQGSSSSCVAQATALLVRAWITQITGKEDPRSPRFIYPQIFQPGGGASLRDGVRIAADQGVCLESSLPSYMSKSPPSEDFMRKAELTDELKKEAKVADKFLNYRMIDGKTGDIDVFAHAISNNCGLVGGFTGTNQGWCRPDIRPPKKGEEKWGHAVWLCAFGKLDVAIGDLPIGTKCLFTTNSWGGRYTITKGRWAGLQAIPESYFTAGEETADGFVKGIYAYNAWALVPTAVIPKNVMIDDFIRKNEGKLIQDSEQSGGFALILNGVALKPEKDRLVELLTTYLVRKEGTGTPKEIWNEIPFKTF